MCPPGVDQTERGPQNWHLVAPRIRKIHRLLMDHFHDPFRTFKPIDFLFSDSKSWDAWSMLAVPAPIPQQTVSRLLNHTNRPRTSRLSKLESLPPELLAAIIADSGLENRDLIALATTSETLWAHVLPQVEKQCSLVQPPLAGVELACTGTYLLTLPNSFLVNDLAESSVSFTRWGRMCEARKINWAALKEYDPVSPSPEKLWREMWKAHAKLMGLSEKLLSKLSVEFLSRCSPVRGTSQDALWVLRNLTTNEYVRCRPGDGSNGVRGFVDCEDGRVKLRVEDVLLMRICWSRVGGLERLSDFVTEQGKWAGHCFDIVPWEHLDGQKGWTDSTDEVMEQATKIAERIDQDNISRENSIWKMKKRTSQADDNSRMKVRKTVV